MRRGCALGLLCLASAAAISWGTAVGAPALTSIAARSVVDNFTADRKLNTNLWLKLNQQGDTSNHEVECYQPSQVRVSHGRGLSETEQYASRGFKCPHGTPDSSNPLHWKSGAVQMRSVNFTYGKVVVRARMAGGVGAWPAIWLLGAACQRPTWLTSSCRWPSNHADAAEVDIAEDLGSNGRTTVNENVYSNSLNHSCTYDTGSSLSSRYHDYELDWTPGSLIFRVDGKRTGCGIRDGDVPSHRMFLIINTAACTTGSTCGAGANPKTFPQTTSVAWVRVSR